MRVPYGLMFVEMRVRLAWRIEGAMGVLVVFIMDVRMGVRHRLMNVLVFMMLGQVQPHAGRHQRASNSELHGDRFAQRDHRSGAADEWSRGEIGACSRRAEMAQSDDEQGEAHAVAEEADNTRDQDRG